MCKAAASDDSRRCGLILTPLRSTVRALRRQNAENRGWRFALKGCFCICAKISGRISFKLLAGRDRWSVPFAATALPMDARNAVAGGDPIGNSLSAAIC